MFTPRWLSVGERVTIKKDLANDEGTFGAGHEFMITDVHFHGDDAVYDLRDHDLNRLTEVASADLTREQPDT